MKKRIINILAVFLILQPYFIFSQENEKPTEPAEVQSTTETKEKIADSYFTGDWGGIRQSMVDKGVTFEMAYISETVYNLGGGISKGYASLGNLDVTLDLDFDKLAGVSGLQIFLYGLGGHGMAPTDFVGDAQATSNIETGQDYFKLYEAWFQYSFLEDKLAILAGLHDLNSEFYANDPAGLFLNSSMGIGTEFAQAGPSIFPMASPALRLLIKPTETFYFSAAAYNATTSDPNDPDTIKTYADFKFKNGALVIAETGLYSEENYKLALGFWTYTDKVESFKEDSITGDPVKESGYGFYLLSDKSFGDISLFFRAGMANAKAFQFSYNIMPGIVFSGNLWGRSDDSFGIGASTIITSKEYKNEMNAASTNVDSHETALEFTYKIQATPWVAIQPDLQYVINPSADPQLKNTLATALRVELVF
ncbi:MAG: carbohydrate porin [Spirochaetia bacterium]|nr:carbohydrate porin [Spirochaetia bacterium]